jgi:hypothetical protein
LAASSVKATYEGLNTKKQAVADASVAADREKITQLSIAGDIDGTRRVLQPYVDQAKAAKTVEDKTAAMNAVIDRLDVTSDKEKMFWSGDSKLAAKIAKERGKTILEQTPGGQVIDEWADLNNTFSWSPGDMAPHGWDLWGKVSEKYAKEAIGEIDIIQTAKKYPGGGPTWRNKEFPILLDENKVTSMNVFCVDESGNIINMMKIDPESAAAANLFPKD